MIIIGDMCHLGSAEPAPRGELGLPACPLLYGGPHGRHYMPQDKAALQVFSPGIRVFTMMNLELGSTEIGNLAGYSTSNN